MDESGTDDDAQEYGAVGCLITNWSLIPEFNEQWNDMLQRRNVIGLHMRELTPDGSLSHIVGNDKSDLLAEAVRLINEYRIFTMASVIKNRDHIAAMPDALPPDTGSVYYTGFLMTVVTNQKMAQQEGYSGTIDFILDRGNRYSSHVAVAHESIRDEPDMERYQVGDAHFCDDAQWPALQAADVIGWSARRRKAGLHLKGPLAPLHDLFDDFFVDQPLEDSVLQQLVAGYRRLIGEHTSAPSRADV